MPLTPYQLSQLAMLSEQERLVALTAERVIDGEDTPELTLLKIKYASEISEYLRVKRLRMQFGQNNQ